MIRLVLMVLLAAAIILMVLVNVPRWPHLDIPERLVRIGFVLLLVANLYGVIDLQVKQEPIAPRTFILTIAVAEIVVALLLMLRRRYRPNHPKRGNHG